MEDIGPAEAHRESGAHRARSPTQPGHRAFATEVATVAGTAVGPDLKSTAAAYVAAGTAADQSGAAMAGSEEDGIAAEKKSLHASERDREENQKRREIFLARLRALPPEKLIFLDESGVTTQMTRLYGRAPAGVRIHEAVPQGRWKVLTILGAISLRGWEAVMTVEAATDTEVFLAYLDTVLCPRLKPGDVVVMDNLSVHKVNGVLERIHACQAELLYLPPYSPDLNPIEKAWSKLKQRLRATKARTAETLDQAIADSLSLITTANLRSWFLHAGYSIPV